VRIVINSDSQLDEICAEWLAESDCKPENPWFVYARHWSRFFGAFAALCKDGAITKYWESRLQVVKRKSVQKETGALKDLLEWCEEKELTGSLVPVPELPSIKRKKNQGVAYHVRRRGKATDISSEQARAIIDQLPEWSKRKTNRYPVRAFFELAYETGLRPYSTLAKLEVPRHYTKGAKVLTITEDIDKAKFARQVPLSEASRRWLDAVCPASGVIFGKHNFRAALTKAVEAAKLPAHLAETMTTYDFKHRAATEMASTGDLPGMMHLMGWKQVTTANRYARPEQQAAARVLAARQVLLDAERGPAAAVETAAEASADAAPIGTEPAAAEPAPLDGARTLPDECAPPSAAAAAPSTADAPRAPAAPAEAAPAAVAAAQPAAPLLQVVPALAPEAESGVLAWGTTGSEALFSASQEGELVNEIKTCARNRGRTCKAFRPLEPEPETAGNPQSFQGMQRSFEASGGAQRDADWGTSPKYPSPAEVLFVAVPILSANALGEPISGNQARELARIAIAGTEVGRLALEVLDGGPRATAAAVQLAGILSVAAMPGSGASRAATGGKP
jgi:integrase